MNHANALVGCKDVGAKLEHQAHLLLDAIVHSVMQRRISVCVVNVDVCAGIQQLLHHVELVGVRSVHEGCHAVIVLAINVRAELLSQQEWSTVRSAASPADQRPCMTNDSTNMARMSP